MCVLNVYAKHCQLVIFSALIFLIFFFHFQQKHRVQYVNSIDNETFPTIHQPKKKREKAGTVHRLNTLEIKYSEVIECELILLYAENTMRKLFSVDKASKQFPKSCKYVDLKHYSLWCEEQCGVSYAVNLKFHYSSQVMDRT